MRTRATLASLLAALMLLVSCASTACAANCSVTGTEGCEHHAAHVRPLPGLQAHTMSHCAMVEVERSQQAQGKSSGYAFPRLISVALCGPHQVCAEQPALLSSSGDVLARAAFYQAQTLSLVPDVAPGPTLQMRLATKPLLRSNSLLLLQTKLRV